MNASFSGTDPERIREAVMAEVEKADAALKERFRAAVRDLEDAVRRGIPMTVTMEEPER